MQGPGGPHLYRFKMRNATGLPKLEAKSLLRSSRLPQTRTTDTDTSPQDRDGIWAKKRIFVAEVKETRRHRSTAQASAFYPPSQLNPDLDVPADVTTRVRLGALAPAYVLHRRTSL